MVEDFINLLAGFNQFNNVENQYANSFHYHLITRNNLTIYLKSMIELKPETILVGEAPGYNGCRLSGIPFTAERNITIEYKNKYLFGLNNGYKIRYINKPQSESSATIVWEYLKLKDIYPLIWNAFPFHPHLENDTESNRKPKIEELEFGKKIFEKLINMYNINKIIAIGNTANETLLKMGFNCRKVRHPANGGKNEFIIGMNNELEV